MINQNCNVQFTYLTSGINNLGGIFLTLVLDDFAEGVFNGRVIALNEVAINELDSKRRFAYGDRSISFGLRTPPSPQRGTRDIPTDRLPTIATLRCFAGETIFAAVKMFVYWSKGRKVVMVKVTFRSELLDPPSLGHPAGDETSELGASLPAESERLVTVQNSTVLCQYMHNPITSVSYSICGLVDQ